MLIKVPFLELCQEQGTPEGIIMTIQKKVIIINTAISKPSYLSDGNAIPNHQGSIFTPVDHYIECPYISVGIDPAAEGEPEYNLEVTLAVLKEAICDFETKFDEMEDWPGKMWTTELYLQTQLDEVKDVAIKSGKEELLSICEELQNKLKYTVMGWEKR